MRPSKSTVEKEANVTDRMVEASTSDIKTIPIPNHETVSVEETDPNARPDPSTKKESTVDSYVLARARYGTRSSIDSFPFDSRALLLVRNRNAKEGASKHAQHAKHAKHAKHGCTFEKGGVHLEAPIHPSCLSLLPNLSEREGERSIVRDLHRPMASQLRRGREQDPLVLHSPLWGKRTRGSDKKEPVHRMERSGSIGRAIPFETGDRYRKGKKVGFAHPLTLLSLSLPVSR